MIVGLGSLANGQIDWLSSDQESVYDSVRPMSAYEDAFKLEQGASAETLAAAARILAHAGGVVLLEGAVALRSTGHELRCEVVDPMHSAHLCAHEYEVMVENARRPLEASGLAALLPDLPRTWLVVDDSGADTTELWRAP